MRRFGLDERERLRTLIREAALDEARAVEEAERLARGWLASLPEGPALADVLVHKAAGYNADLHAHTRRVLKAIAGADAFLAGSRHLRFELPDLLLGEYVLWERVRALGGMVECSHDPERLRDAFVRSRPSREDSPGYEACELALPRAAPRVLSGPPIDVLFIASMPNYLNPMREVMAAQRRAGSRVALLAPAAARAWRPELPTGVELLAIEEFAARGEDAPVAPRHAPLRLDGVDLRPLAAVDLERLYRAYAPFVAAMRALGAGLASERSIGRAVVARLRRATELTLVTALRRARVPIDMLLHGHVSPSPDRRFIDGSFSGVDRVLAWSSRQRRDVLGKVDAPDSERVLITGNPEWDSLFDRAVGGDAARREARGRCAAALGLASDAPWLVFTTQDLSRPVLPDVLGAIEGAPGACLIIKMHPAERASDYAAMVPATLASRVRVVAGSPPSLHDLLHAADATLTFHSTTNLESLVLGTPVISLALGPLAGQDRLVALEEFGLPVAESPETLRAVVGRVAHDPDGWRASLAPCVERAVAALTQGRGARAAPRVASLLVPEHAAAAPRDLRATPASRPATTPPARA